MCGYKFVCVCVCVCVCVGVGVGVGVGVLQTCGFHVGTPTHLPTHASFTSAVRSTSQAEGMEL